MGTAGLFSERAGRVCVVRGWYAGWAWLGEVIVAERIECVGMGVQNGNREVCPKTKYIYCSRIKFGDRGLFFRCFVFEITTLAAAQRGKQSATHTALEIRGGKRNNSLSHLV